jgi:hypothetical protein
MMFSLLNASPEGRVAELLVPSAAAALQASIDWQFLNFWACCTAVPAFSLWVRETATVQRSLITEISHKTTQQPWQYTANYHMKPCTHA